jgi:hypothetical protein
MDGETIQLDVEDSFCIILSKEKIIGFMLKINKEMIDLKLKRRNLY